MRATGLRDGSMEHCSVKIDADGNVHILSPGYRVATDKDGKPLRIEGQSDFGGAPKRRAANLSRRYVLVYEPNARVPFTFEIAINGKPFRSIDLGTAAFTVDVTTVLKSGSNGIHVVGKPAGTPPPRSGESDVVKLRILAGEERSDGTFVAQLPPVWELVRSALDQTPIDRNVSTRRTPPWRRRNDAVPSPHGAVSAPSEVPMAMPSRLSIRERRQLERAASTSERSPFPFIPVVVEASPSPPTVEVVVGAVAVNVPVGADVAWVAELALYLAARSPSC